LSLAEAYELSGQVAVVTGGGRGLGREFAIGLAAAGASVAVIARSEDQLSETARIIAEVGGKGIAVVGDVSNPRTVENLAAEVEERLGPVDLLINNAGIAAPFGPVSEADQYICDRTRNGANRHGAKRIGIRSGAQMAALVWKTIRSRTRRAAGSRGATGPAFGLRANGCPSRPLYHRIRRLGTHVRRR
jgi:NAD(P)-dependent dehydrogenase (short-subunit alcohol dehydrogenase family)